VDEELPSAIEAFSSPEVEKVKLENFGRAPEIHNTVWLNTSEALYLKDLRGKVVLLEMWTFGCINCKNVIPSLNEWHDKYQEDGLVIIGNHYPEFAYEREWENVAQAVEDYGIRYPVAQDNEGQTWRAYNNRYWPALFLIDKFGMIRYKHIGEGAYAKTEAAIQALLAEEFVK
jgi:thiol-disulfide isomerase/thioredoxin